MRSSVLKKAVASLLCFLLIFAPGAPMLAALRAFAAETLVTVYVNGGTGDDSNSGLEPNAPLKTIRRAYEAVYSEMADAGRANDADGEARIVLTGDTEFSFYNSSSGVAAVRPTNFTSHVFRITFTSVTGSETLSFAAYSSAEGAASPSVVTGNHAYNLIGPTTFEHITIRNTRARHRIHAAANSDLVIGEGVHCVPFRSGSTDYYLSLVPTPQPSGTVANGRLIVHSGQWQNLYALSYTSVPTAGGGYLYMDGGTALKVGTVYSGDVRVPSEIHLKNVTIGDLYGGDMALASTEKTYASDLVLDLANVTVTGHYSTGVLPIQGDLTLSLFNVTAPTELEINCSGTVKSVDSIAVPSGESLTLSGDQVAEYANFYGGGALVLGQNATLSVIGEVSGPTGFTVAGAPLSRTYIQAPAATPDNAFVYAGSEEVIISVEGSVKKWSFFDDSGFKGVILTAPEGVTFSLYTGFSDGAAVTPDQVRTANGVRYQYYGALTSGRYRCVASGTGYYRETRNLFLSAAKLATRTLIDVDPGRIGGNGYEPTGNVLTMTDEMYQNSLSSDPYLTDYAHVLTTPAFTQPMARHEFTSQEQMEAYLAFLDDETKDAYQFTLARSGQYQYALPIIIFSKTDLSGCSDWQEAASLLRANGKPTLHYQAQVHGNEPASGEGALAVLGQLYADDAWRDQILNSINLYVIPRVNPDGSRAFTRNNVLENIDMNRDYMTASAAEVRAILAAIRAFDPYVRIDGHEYNNNNVSGACYDVLMHTGGLINLPPELCDIGSQFLLTCFEYLDQEGLRANGYVDVNGKGGGNTVNSVNPTTATVYNAMDGAISFLIESRGIYNGKNAYARRVVSQYLGVKSLIDQTASRAAEVKSTVETARARMVEKGTTYDPGDLFILECTQSKNPDTAMIWKTPAVNYANGRVTGVTENTAVNYYDTVLRSRPRATAYLLPKGESWEGELIRLLTVHGIDYYEIPAGSAAAVRQYTGDTAAAALAQETVVTFPDGAVVIPLAQKNALIASYLIEPDVTEIKEGSGSLAQSGVIAAKDGVFPIYRYERDLEDGYAVAYTAPGGVLWGDANGDRQINNADIVRLKNYFANYDDETGISFSGTAVYELSAGADANGDGKFSNADIVRLKNYFANYDDETGVSFNGTTVYILGPAAA